MLKKRNLFLILIVGIFISLISCTNFRSFFPLEHMYYPAFANGFNKEIVAITKYKNEQLLFGKFKQYERVWQRFKDFEIILINIYDLNINLIANYQKEYLDLIRQQNGNPQNEFWVAYEGGLVLIPEEYHHGDDWQKYIESIK